MTNGPVSPTPASAPSDSTAPPRVRFVDLAGPPMTALADGDLDAAGAAAGITLPDYFVTDTARRLWRMRLAQVADDPGSARWFARAAVSETEGVVVGYSGFHGPPDRVGMVELGYSVVPEFRRRGYARAMLTAMAERAAAEPDVATLRVTISPDNAASLATIVGFGFVRVGEQIDEIDGLEIIFEVPVGTTPRT
ncbi:GNAT family N-acetyltransferase [Streptomyces sp. SID3343]|uniref:GNAT family N-acetyltransferase n=1 Tax=Streptomyces sp. SID3343 TaxID=2690260 RepID=UPI0013697F14|nr:GNAT family N-acetyltransferase [Streptomyces sp. SID3343]MYW01907.1 GNAT family N-acetyltransferase [Streptomyces sp. SID3343]